ncbi:uncharacterized protein TM35_000261970 [Trypanosoma theileri]|uniref:Uncharacterized protein n=1 Tax=Trypanosoma theileri TaxID=67003 RepID=A0A1X0NPW2_9TRYP|nr:uncharacterized protein TM35_000261970 [Trypanosoma theileri]ORC86745.1 hypothetical protein TM35_000261970 [Trypanosoma theileri]
MAAIFVVFIFVGFLLCGVLFILARRRFLALRRQQQQQQEGIFAAQSVTLEDLSPPRQRQGDISTPDHQRNTKRNRNNRANNNGHNVENGNGNEEEEEIYDGLDYAGEVNAAVVLRHRFDMPNPPRHRHHVHHREVLHQPSNQRDHSNRNNSNNDNNGSSSSSSTDSDIDPVALRQKPLEEEVETEEMRVLRECAVVGVVLRGEEEMPPPPVARPRGGVIYRMPRSAFTPTPLTLTRSLTPSPASSHLTHATEEPQQHAISGGSGSGGMTTAGSYLNFSHPTTPLHTAARGLDSTLTSQDNGNTIGVVSSRKKRVRKDSALVYGQAAYTGESPEEMFMQTTGMNKDFKGESATSFENLVGGGGGEQGGTVLFPKNKTIQGCMDTTKPTLQTTAAVEAGVGITPSVYSNNNNNNSNGIAMNFNNFMGGRPPLQSLNTVVGSSTYHGNGGSNTNGEKDARVFGVSVNSQRTSQFSHDNDNNDNDDEMSRPPPFGASAATAAPTVHDAFAVLMADTPSSCEQARSPFFMFGNSDNNNNNDSTTSHTRQLST